MEKAADNAHVRIQEKGITIPPTSGSQGMPPVSEQEKCRRCGTCCLANMAAFSGTISDDDRTRWVREGRSDILRTMETEGAVWAGDHFVSGRDGNYLHECPFLRRSEEFYICDIYQTRPQVCRDYIPGSSEICPLFEK